MYVTVLPAAQMRKEMLQFQCKEVKKENYCHPPFFLALGLAFN